MPHALHRAAVEKGNDLVQLAVHVADNIICFRLLAFQGNRAVVVIVSIVGRWRAESEILNGLRAVGEVGIDLQAQHLERWLRIAHVGRGKHERPKGHARAEAFAAHGFERVVPRGAYVVVPNRVEVERDLRQQYLAELSQIFFIRCCADGFEQFVAVVGEKVLVAEVCGVGGADGVVSVHVSVKISHSRFVAEHVAEEGGVVADGPGGFCGKVHDLSARHHEFDADLLGDVERLDYFAGCVVAVNAYVEACIAHDAVVFKAMARAVCPDKSENRNFGCYGNRQAEEKGEKYLAEF